MTQQYTLLQEQLKALVEGVPHLIANLSNASALIMDSLPDLNWAGFYLLEEDTLVLGPFQGKPACITIAVGRGVCGTAVKEGVTQLVPDVHAFPGHIACDCASRSEIVIPLRKDGAVVAVLDMDSPTAGRFTQEDQEGLEALVPILEAVFQSSSPFPPI